MQSLANVLGGLRIRALNPRMAMVLALAVGVGMAGQVDAQRTRYTLDDVMDKLIEMDKRLVVVETDIKNMKDQMKEDKVELREQMKADKAELGEQIADVRTTVWTLFGFLGVGLLGMVGFLFSVSNKMGRLSERMGHLETILVGGAPEKEQSESGKRGVFVSAKLLQSLQKQIRETARGQKELEEKLRTAEII